MDRASALEKLLASFAGYYNINRETPAAPFAAEAEFYLQHEQYFLVKAARISHSFAREIVFFALEEHLDEKRLLELADKAWTEGLGRVELIPDHRQTDVSLCILAGRIDPEAAGAARRISRSKSYMFGLRGYSHFRLAVYDLSNRTLARNRMGEDLGKAISNTL